MDGDLAPTGGIEDEAVLAARARAGRAVRDLGHALVGHHASAEHIEQLAADLERWAARLAVGGRRGREPATFGYTWAEAPADGEPILSWGDRPVSGACSPWGVDLAVRRERHDVVADVELRAAHEGAPGRSHGGVVAAIFDDLMGFVLQIEQLTAFTGEITVRYQAPVPLFVPIEIRARLRERTGRKLLIEAEMAAEGRLVARSAAVFITVEGYAGA